MPAGTEVIVGLRRRRHQPRRRRPPIAAARPRRRPRPRTATAKPSGQAPVSLLPTAPLPSDIAGEPGIADGGPPGSDAAPPGGYTLDAPIDPARKAALLGPSYLFPLAGGARFQNDFGAPRADTRFNQGIDLFAPLGTPVLAAHDGTLVQVGWSNIGGRQEWLRDSAGNLFYYGHLSAYAPVAKTGAAVHAGDVIGFLGDSGDAQGTAYHLHFEIHPAGKWAVAPYPYVSAWLDNSAPLGGVTPASEHPGGARAAGLVRHLDRHGPRAADGRRGRQRAVRSRRRHRRDRGRPACADRRAAAGAHAAGRPVLLRRVGPRATSA